ncbi:MAG: TetR/AcrR family transcriptional regulator [Rhizobiaceae bacterium]
MDDLDTAAPVAAEEGDAQPMSRAERRDQQVQRILDAAKACFVRYGFQGASMQQVCAEAGMSPGALYRYFASKEAIIEAITDADAREDAKIFEVMLASKSVVDGVVEAAMAHIRHVHEHGLAGLFAEIRAESMRNPSIRTCCTEHMGQIMGLFHVHLGAAIQRGDIAPVVGLETLLPTILSFCEGLAINDPLGQGMADADLQTIIRATAVALLRPAPTTA